MKRKIVFVHEHPINNMKSITVCRNCGRLSTYGKLINYRGHSSCPRCYDAMRNHIENIRDNDYERYRTEPHLYQLSDEKYYPLLLNLLKSNRARLTTLIEKVEQERDARCG